MDDLVTVDQYRQHILQGIRPLGAFPQPLMDALGLPIAETVRAAMQLPRFDNSAMDGYAVVADDVAEASPEHPVRLPVVGEIGAGQANHLALSPGTAVKIMTGAPMPRGADAVVPYEVTDRGVANVEIRKAPRLAQHVRRAGEDITVGDTLVEEGTVLDPRHLGLLAAVGRATVQTRPRPRVVVISTGTELREPGTQLPSDAIFDSNSYLIAAAARRAGAITYRVGVVPDDPAEFIDALSDQLVRADLVVTSGGVSMGDYDVVKAALADMGQVWFGGVAMQPGKPQGFGFVGDENTPIFTLPGNPVSSYISFEVFVVPALRAMMGRQPAMRQLISATLTESISSAEGKRQYVRARFEHTPQGSKVTPIGGHGSHLLGDLAQANCCVVVGESVAKIPAGATVSVQLFDEEF